MFWSGAKNSENFPYRGALCETFRRRTKIFLRKFLRKHESCFVFFHSSNQKWNQTFWIHGVRKKTCPAPCTVSSGTKRILSALRGDFWKLFPAAGLPPIRTKRWCPWGVCCKERLLRGTCAHVEVISWLSVNIWPIWGSSLL